MFFGKSPNESGISLDPIYDEIAMIDRLANGDITKYESVKQVSYIECLNTLAYWNARDEAIEISRNIENAKQSARIRR